MGENTSAREESYLKMVERSLIGTGNNFRMKKAIEKAQKGDILTIVYFGGSITEGYKVEPDNSYAKLSYDYITQTFGAGDHIKFINAGQSATTSTLGLIRVERDVLQYKPDIVFVEFAINDSKNATSMAVFESLLIRLLNHDTSPAVVLLFSVSQAGYSCQNEMEQVGKHYGLPMISVRDAVMPEIRAGRMAIEAYFHDHTHPNNHGHKLITEFIKHYFEKVNKEELDCMYHIPKSAVYGSDFTNLKMLDASNTPLSSSGGFIQEHTVDLFPKGWTHKAVASNESFIFDLECKNLFIVYKRSRVTTTGTIDIYIDNVLKLYVDGYNSTGWNNPVSELIFREDTAEKHKIEIKMSKGSEKKDFSILAFGYSD